jgi:hypothetical protein
LPLSVPAVILSEAKDPEELHPPQAIHSFQPKPFRFEFSPTPHKKPQIRPKLLTLL